MALVNNSELVFSGTKLYYETRGSGPLLLMIHGGNGDADSYPMAERLAKRYTVVTYDRRGHSRSKLEYPNENYRISAHSDDASRLLAELSDEPAYVFGCSLGVVIGLDLAIRHPEQIQTLVVHEPPIPRLLSGDDPTLGLESLEKLERCYRQSGLSALEEFAAAMGITASAQPQQSAKRMERLMANIDYFILSEVPALRAYRPDTKRLKASSAVVVPAGGIDSKGFLPYRYAEALANELGTKVVDFLGNHVGCSVYPKAFAAQLLGFSNKSAIHANRLPGDPLRLFADQKLDHIRDVLRFTDAAESNLLFQPFDLLLRFPFCKQLCIDRSRSNRINCDLLDGEFFCKLAGELFNSSFCTGIYAVCRKHLACDRRGEVNNPSFLFHVSHRLLASKIRSFYIKVELSVKIVFGNVLNRFINTYSRVVDQDIHFAKCFYRLIE